MAKQTIHKTTRSVGQKPPLEKDIQRAICEYLEHLMNRGHLFFWRQNTAPAFDWKTNQFRRMPKYSLNGVPDIIVVKGPYVIFLEVKRKNTKQNLDQIQFQEFCKEQGAEYYVVRSIDDVIQLGLESKNR